MKLLLVLVGLFIAANARYVKRNAYGDEAVTPVAPVDDGYGAPVPTEAPEPEETAAPVEQGYGATESGVEPSGYRKKRNAYGDEAVTPEAPIEGGYGAPAPTEAPVVEETAAPVEQGYGATESGVEPSGYRK